jgi:hypothetical protein
MEEFVDSLIEDLLSYNDLTHEGYDNRGFENGETYVIESYEKKKEIFDKDVQSNLLYY